MSKWIKIDWDDRKTLPEIGCYVLVIDIYGCNHICHFMVFNDGDCFCNKGGYFFNITHWYPLPSPPEPDV